jgi:hypothetical protein
VVRPISAQAWNTCNSVKSPASLLIINSGMVGANEPTKVLAGGEMFPLSSPRT